MSEKWNIVGWNPEKKKWTQGKPLITEKNNTKKCIEGLHVDACIMYGLHNIS